MKEWSERTPAVAHLLNPVLLAVVVAGAASEYERRISEPMPFAYAFLVAPLVLHRETREKLPKRIDSHLSRWASNHEVLVAGFGARAKALVPAVQEGVRFGIRAGSLEFVSGDLVGHPGRARPARVGDIAQIVQKSGFVGKWLSQSDSPTTTFTLLGVTP